MKFIPKHKDGKTITKKPVAKNVGQPKSDATDMNMDQTPAIMELQKNLNKKGAGLKVDGKFGPKTKAAREKYDPEHKQMYKTGGTVKKKKCACGCAMKLAKNAKGGLVESCACGCKKK